VSWLSRSAASLAQLVVNIIAADPYDKAEGDLVMRRVQVH
jgi:hypothetical protein